MKENRFNRESVWLRASDLDAAFSCLRDNLLGEGIERRLELAQEVVSAVVGWDPDALVSEATPRSPRELANAINVSASWHIRIAKPKAGESVAWCPIHPDQVEVAGTARELAAVVATRILPIDDLAIAENAACLGRLD